MPTALDRLIALLPPPARPHPVDWSTVERSLGHALPSDYKSLVQAYGPGTFDGFLWLLQPLAGNPNLDLVTQRDRQLEGLRMLERGGQPMPHPVTGPRPALLPWGITDNGDVGYWVREPLEHPDSWPVTVNDSRAPEWCDFDGPVTAFLYAVLTGALRCEMFPPEFPSDRPVFTPLARPATGE